MQCGGGQVKGGLHPLLPDAVGQKEVQKVVGLPGLQHQPVLPDVQGEVPAAAHPRQLHRGNQQAGTVRVTLYCG